MIIDNPNNVNVTKGMIRLDMLRHWMLVHYDYLTGSIVGTYTGIIIVPEYLTNLLSTLLICVLTGFAGAFGAHLFKKVLDLFNKKSKPQSL